DRGARAVAGHGRVHQRGGGDAAPRRVGAGRPRRRRPRARHGHRGGVRWPARRAALGGTAAVRLGLPPLRPTRREGCAAGRSDSDDVREAECGGRRLQPLDDQRAGVRHARRHAALPPRARPTLPPAHAQRERRHPSDTPAPPHLRDRQPRRPTHRGRAQGRGDAGRLPDDGGGLHRRPAGPVAVPLPHAAAHGLRLHGLVRLRMSTATTRGRAGEVAAAFLWLGLTSFGGPVAHLGYFRRAFVQQRRWLDEEHFSQLLALCQVLPGPASSQLGFSIGLLRAGWLGGLAAFVGFTLPSAVLQVGVALARRALGGGWGQALVHGLKLVAVAVVLHGVVGMARTLAPDWTRRAMALAAALLVLASGAPWMQLVLVAGGALAGRWLCRGVAARTGGMFGLAWGRRTGAVLVALFVLGLGVAFLPGPPPLGRAAAAFYRAGALVFGGGHVVLPLLKASVVDPGWLDNNT